MKKRTQYLIDKKFQIRHTFSILGWLFSVVALVVVIIGFNAGYNNYRLQDITAKNNEMIQAMKNIIMLQNNVVLSILTWSQSPDGTTPKDAVQMVEKRRDENNKTMESNINTIQGNIAIINSIITYNYVLLGLIIFIILVQGIFFYYMLIRRTHRISGPIYVISNYIRDIINGKYPDLRELRKNDELKDFYGLFAEMVDRLKERDNRKK